MTTITSWMDHNFYPDVSDKWDAAEFREQVLIRLRRMRQRIQEGPGDPGSVKVLDLGAGAGTLPHMDFREVGVTVFGCDIDSNIRFNQHIEAGVICDASALPYRDETFDIVLCCNVLEHIENPEMVFSEVARVLKKGGVFLAKTPNRRHYVTLAARWTPFWFHCWINKLRGRSESDTFPTFYCANTPDRLRRLASSAALNIASMTCTERRPEYCRLNPVLYGLGILYEKFVNQSPRFESLRVNLIAVLEKVDSSLPFSKSA